MSNMTYAQTLATIEQVARAALNRDVAARAKRVDIGRLVHQSGEKASKIARDLGKREGTAHLGLSAGNISQWVGLYVAFTEAGFTVSDVAERGSLDKTYRWAVAGDAPAMTPAAILALSPAEYDALPARPPKGDGKASGRTLIQVDVETKAALDKVRDEDETYDALLLRLIDRVSAPRVRAPRESGLPTVQA